MIKRVENINDVDIESCHYSVRINNDIFIPSSMMFRIKIPLVHTGPAYNKCKIYLLPLDVNCIDVLETASAQTIPHIYRYELETSKGYINILKNNCSFHKDNGFYVFIGDKFYILPILSYETYYCFKVTDFKKSTSKFHYIKREKFDIFHTQLYKRNKLSDEPLKIRALFYGLYIKDFFSDLEAIKEKNYLFVDEYAKLILNNDIKISNYNFWDEILVGIDNLGIPYIEGKYAQRFDFFSSVYRQLKKACKTNYVYYDRSKVNVKFTKMRMAIPENVLKEMISMKKYKKFKTLIKSKIDEI